MPSMNRVLTGLAAAALAGLALASGAAAQLGNASARTLGLGGNATATASRFEAISVNPAGLGMPGGGFSLAVLPMTFRSGLGPVGLGDLDGVAGQLVSSSTKEAWLAEIAEAGRETGTGGGDISLLALTAGRFGLQITTLGGGDVDLAPDVVEVLLYGNAGRSGAPADLSFTGSALDGYAVTTLAGSLGLPIRTASGAMAMGATLKYSVGHGVIAGRDRGGRLQSDPIRVDLDFPLVMTEDEDYDANGGTGVGVDLGFQMQRDRLRIGAAVLNVFNTFAWDEDKIAYRPGTATLEEGDNATDFDKQPYSAAPADLRAAVEDLTFDPVVSLGAAWDAGPDFTLTADVRNRFGDGMSLTPKLHVGAGAEFRGLGALQLRGGGAVVTGGFQVGGGATLVLGPVNLSFASAFQAGEEVDVAIGQFTLSFGGR